MNDLRPVRRGYALAVFAKMVGVPRGRIYDAVSHGKIKATRMSGGLVILEDEAERVLRSMTRIEDTRGKHRVVFEELV